MKKLVFYKVHGAGNDFVIIGSNQKIKNRKKLVSLLCDRNFGVGADGVVFLDKPKNKKHTYRWDFYNSDGSNAEACMNASRCVVLYAKQVEKKKEPITFETRSGVMMGKVVSNGAELQLNSPFKFPEERYIEMSGSLDQHKVGGFFINTGVPHFVIIQEDWNPESWLTMAAEVQRHPEFLPQETNVTFMKIDSPKKIRAITFERGVRDYTLACGTGAVAAALTALSLSAQNEIEVTMPGGKLRFYSKNKKNFLRGPAVIVYKGELNLR